jgi:hypothetical protein
MRKLLVLGVALVISSGVALAQTQPMPHEGNIWAGEDHQPIKSEVLQQEWEAGTTPSQRQQQSADGEVESMYQRLMRESSG